MLLCLSGSALSVVKDALFGVRVRYRCCHLDRLPGISLVNGRGTSVKGEQSNPILPPYALLGLSGIFLSFSFPFNQVSDELICDSAPQSGYRNPAGMLGRANKGETNTVRLTREQRRLTTCASNALSTIAIMQFAEPGSRYFMSLVRRSCGTFYTHKVRVHSCEPGMAEREGPDIIQAVILILLLSTTFDYCASAGSVNQTATLISRCSLSTSDAQLLCCTACIPCLHDYFRLRLRHRSSLQSRSFHAIVKN